MPFRPFTQTRDLSLNSAFTLAVGEVIQTSREPFVRPAKIALRFDDAVYVCRREKSVTQPEAFWKTMRQIAWQAKSTDFDTAIANEARHFAQRQAQELDAYRQSLPFYHFFAKWTARPLPFHPPYAADGQKVLMAVDWSNACSVKLAFSMLRTWAKSNSVSPLQSALGQSVYNHPSMG